MRPERRVEPTTNGPLVPLTITLGHTSAELRRLSEIASELDCFLGGVDLVALGPAQNGLELLQKVDILAQSIAGLADFTAELARLTPVDVEVAVATATQVLRLGSLVHALGRPEAGTSDASSRTCEMPVLF